MKNFTINTINIEVEEDITILDAALQLGIKIPTMCFLKEFSPSVSCMVCVVEDKSSGKILPACSALAQDGMQIETDNAEIVSLRKSALELLLSDHLGDCEAPCQRACPSHINIPLMNRYAAKNDFENAGKTIKEAIISKSEACESCTSPCEKVCRRNSIDQPVSIKLIRHFTEKNSNTFSQIEQKINQTEKKKSFNSSYGKIRENEKTEFIKDATNKGVRIEPKNNSKYFTFEEAIAEAGRCMHCDCRKIETCKLKIQSENYLAKQRTYQLSERKPVTKIILPQSIIYEPQKCIKCGICIQVSAKYDDAGFTFIGRGFDIHVGFPLNKSIEKSINKAAKECAEHCPTGAIALIEY